MPRTIDPTSEHANNEVLTQSNPNHATEGDLLTGNNPPSMKAIPELQGLRGIWPRGDRLEAIREGARAFHKRFAAGPKVEAVRRVKIAEAPYPAQYAFQNYNLRINPIIQILNRMLIVQYMDFAGELKTLVWEPTVADGTAEAPFYEGLITLGGRINGSERMRAMFSKEYNDPDDVLPSFGMSNRDVDYVSFDHLHVQDVRRIMGSTIPLDGETEPRESLFPNGKLLVHRKELGTFESMHPMQRAWYVHKGMDGVPEDTLEIFEDSVELGHGIALLFTPGHTDGNHSLAINTDDGVWVQSENGMAVDAWHPEHSKMPGLKFWSEFYDREVVLNANTLEDSVDQYDSMILEREVASRSSVDPRFSQVFPSSECMSKKRQFPIRPTFVHDFPDYGELQRPGR